MLLSAVSLSIYCSLRMSIYLIGSFSRSPLRDLGKEMVAHKLVLERSVVGSGLSKYSTRAIIVKSGENARIRSTHSSEPSVESLTEQTALPTLLFLSIHFPSVDPIYFLPDMTWSRTVRAKLIATPPKAGEH